MMNGIRERASSIGTTLTNWFSDVVDWLPLAVLIGAGPGLALAIVRHGGVGFAQAKDGGVGFAQTKDGGANLVSLYDAQARHWTASVLLASVALWLLGYAIVGGWRRRVSKETSQRTIFVDLNRRLLPVATLPIVAYLFNNRTTPRIDPVDLTLIAVFAITLAYWCFHFVRERRLQWLSRFQPKSAVIPFVTLLSLWVVYSSITAYASIIDHWNMGTRILDLGVYHNTVLNSSQGRWLQSVFTSTGTHVSSHFDPILIVISPLYWIYPHAETLLVLQSFWLGSAAIPLYLYARRKGFGYVEALVIAIAYWLMPALHGINFYEFHSLALMVPLVIFALYWLEGERWWFYAISIALLLLVREDQALIVGTLGLYALVTRRLRVGALTLAGALAYAIFVHYVTRSILGPGGSRTYEDYYTEIMAPGKTGASGLLYSVLSNPMLAVAAVLKLTKIYYFLKLLLPLCFLPLFAGRKLWLLAYGAAFIGLATRWSVPSVHYQYSALILPFLMVAAVDGIERLFAANAMDRLKVPKQPLRVACFVAISVASVGNSLTFGAWSTNQGFGSGGSSLQRKYGASQSARRKLMKRLLKQIPEEASLCVNSALGAHIDRAQNVYVWPRCKTADYFFIYKGRLKPPAIQDALSRLKKLGEPRFEDKNFSLYEAKSEDSKNSDVTNDATGVDDAE